MTLFYDSKTRKARVWVFASFIIIPFTVFILMWLGTKKAVEREKIRKSQEAEIDIFDKF